MPSSPLRVAVAGLGYWGPNLARNFAALREHNAAAAPADRLRLVLAGRLNSDDEAMLAEAGLGDAVERLGLLGRDDALALQRSADALLLVTGRNRSEATGKLFEYLASGRPIVALAHRNEAARIIGETGTGRAVDRDDATGLRDALQALADGTLEREYAPRGLERFRYPAPADAVATLVERAIERRLSSAQ